MKFDSGDEACGGDGIGTEGEQLVPHRPHPPPSLFPPPDEFVLRLSIASGPSQSVPHVKATRPPSLSDIAPFLGEIEWSSERKKVAYFIAN